MSKVCLWINVLILLIGALVAAADDNMTAVRIQLQWVPQAQFAGYYVAQELGFYEAVGLDVTILEGSADIIPIDVVIAGGADLGVTWVPKVLKANETGADLVNIAQIFQRSGSVEVSLAESGIKSVTDLVLKNVGYWGNDNEFELFAALWKSGIDTSSGEHLNLVSQPFDLTPLLNGELDAAQALVYNGYGRILGVVNPVTGELYQEDELNIIDFNEIGTAMLQDHIFVAAEWLARDDNEALAISLIQATLRGWIHCRDHADDCVRILRELDPSLGESHQQWQMNEVNKLIWPSLDGIGAMDKDLWDQTVEWLLTIQALGEESEDGAYRDDLVKQALESLETEGLDVTGEDWQAAQVTVRAGGE